ncbi:MAG: sulfur carrier protein ThiS [Candidatus Ancillula sp.]|nr:sulfur carrier protein ThiS [Candidatus Ancillula sp.]
MQNVVVNGKDVPGLSGKTVLTGLNELGFDPETVVVEMNGEIVSVSDFDQIIVPEGAVLEVLRFVGGG